MSRRFLKRTVALDVIGDENPTGAKTAQGRFEFPLHVRVRMQAVVHEHIDAPSRPTNLWQNLPRRSDSERPSTPQIIWNEAAHMFDSIRNKWREVDAMESSVSVLGKSLENIG